MKKMIEIIEDKIHIYLATLQKEVNKAFEIVS